MKNFDKKYLVNGKKYLAGTDEAGRGPLAGPVVAAAVVLKTRRFKNRIDDSKKLSARQREKAFREIGTKSVFGIGIVSEKVIDEINILQATLMAMKQAVSELCSKLEERKPLKKKMHVLVDGNMKLETGISTTSIIAGDTKSKSIACASILAKVTRDRIMDAYDKVYPQYGFIRHKGYSTEMHRKALLKFGPSEIHRKTFSYV